MAIIEVASTQAYSYDNNNNNNNNPVIAVYVIEVS